MARARTIKPIFFTNEDLAKCLPLARLLFIGLWCLADKEGKLEDRPERIKASVLPYDKCDADKLLDQLHHSGFILRYTVGTVRVIQVASWAKHARCHPDESSDGLPDQPQGTIVPCVETTVGCALTLNSNSNTPPTPPTGGVDTGTAVLPTKPRKPKDAPAPGFDAFWEAYPRKDAKIRAERAWNSLRPDPQLQAAMLAALARQRCSKQWLRDDGQYIPLPATYLNQRRWEDGGVAARAKEADVDPLAAMAAGRQEAKERRARAAPPPGKEGDRG